MIKVYRVIVSLVLYYIEKQNWIQFRIFANVSALKRQNQDFIRELNAQNFYDVSASPQPSYLSQNVRVQHMFL